MPQPNSGRISRSPGAVPRISRMDWRTLSSYSARTKPCVAGSSRGGKAVPTPRKGLAISSPDPDVAAGDDDADRRVGGIVAGFSNVAVARGRLAIDTHLASDLGDGAAIGRWL